MRSLFLIIGFFYCCGLHAQQSLVGPSKSLAGSGAATRPLRWAFAGERGITWKVRTNDVHKDQIEITGMKTSAIITYGIDSNSRLVLQRKLVFPMLRRIP